MALDNYALSTSIVSILTRACYQVRCRLANPRVDLEVPSAEVTSDCRPCLAYTGVARRSKQLYPAPEPYSLNFTSLKPHTLLTIRYMSPKPPASSRTATRAWRSATAAEKRKRTWNGDSMLLLYLQVSVSDCLLMLEILVCFCCVFRCVFRCVLVYMPAYIGGARAHTRA